MLVVLNRPNMLGRKEPNDDHYRSRFPPRVSASSLPFVIPESLARMMTSRNSPNISGFQLQDLAAVSSFSSELSYSLSLRPCSGHSLNFGTLMRRFRSSPLWSVRRNVRGAQFKFA